MDSLSRTEWVELWIHPQGECPRRVGGLFSDNVLLGELLWCTHPGLEEL